MYPLSHLQIINDANDISKMKTKLDILSNEDRQKEAVMYVLVNTDIKMDKGKIANQCCHSVARATTK